MRLYDADEIAGLLPWPALIDGLAATLGEPASSPQRQVYTVSHPGAPEDALLLMPAWITGQVIGVKVVTFFSSNSERGLPNIHATYLLLDGQTGEPLALLDGEELGSRRTMAASALASRTLSRPDARRLLIVGTGQLAPHAIAAHTAVRDFDVVEVWGRRLDAAEIVADRLAAEGVVVEVSRDLDASVSEADVISCVTSATAPLVRGVLLKDGCHLDLVGSFKTDMRESDDDCIRRATVFVDTVEGASLSGDLAQPIASGLFSPDDVEADLVSLATGRHPGRSDDAQITLFKSAGFALEDLAAARLVVGSSTET